jgi:hypothetical protein
MADYYTSYYAAVGIEDGGRVSAVEIFTKREDRDAFTRDYPKYVPAEGNCTPVFYNQETKSLEV